MSTGAHDELRDRYDALINGESVAAADGATIEIENPATEATISTLSACGEAEIDDAVASATAAFEGWSRLDPDARASRLFDLSAAIRDHKQRLATLETLDNGKAISRARADVEGCAKYFEYFAGLADKVHGESIPLGTDYVDYVIREPLGVTGHIVPWNFPINLLARSVAPALATGNVAVVKPAEQTSMTAVEVGKLGVESGIPPGVMNVVPGLGREAGRALSSHPDVDGISFTGSVETGREVAKNAVENVNPVHLELGGKSPNVVFPNADFETAVQHTLAAIFTTTSGQMCLGGSRLLLHKSIHEEFLDRLVAAIEPLDIGPGLDDPDVGPLAWEGQYETVLEYLDVGRSEVGEPVVGGDPLDREGYFVEPTIFDGVDNGARIAQEEIFGPVLSVMSFADEAEAIKLANDVEYGLVAGIFTNDLGRAHRFARDVDAGQIYINEWFAQGYGTPFGGYKQSGIGREKGMEAIREYTQTKNVCANIAR
jgi:acyl-CoA reductase-like NAD-dependent aldehyde dehydrogenase